MRKFIAALAVALVLLGGCAAPRAAVSTGDNAIADAFAHHRSAVTVSGTGTVSRILSDDTQGGRHQRFILRLASGQSLLFAHNIDIAPRVKGLAVGDTVEFSGQYEFNAQGGVVHWTHHDPSGKHPTGWLKHDGVTYQ